MAIRFCVMPLERTAQNQRGPNHLDWHATANPAPISAVWCLKDYGLADFCIVCADLTTAQVTTLQGFADTLVLPANIDSTISSANATLAVTYLEARNFPATGWLVAGMTYRVILKRLLGMIFFIQRFHTLLGRNQFNDAGVTLDTQINALPADAIAKLSQAALDLGFDTSGITGTTTIRAALKNLADQWGTRPILFGSLATL